MSSPPPPPREVPRDRAARQRVYGVAPMLLTMLGMSWLVTCVATGVLLTLLSSGAPWDDRVLDARAQRAEARPTGVRATATRINNHRLYAVGLDFSDAAGTVHHVERSTADAATLLAARNGATIAVEYDPEQPTRLRIVGQRASLIAPFLVIPAAIALVAGALAALGLRLGSKRRRLYRDGESARARVLAVQATAIRINRRPASRVEYEFLASDGNTRRHKRLLTEPPAEGGELWVVYDPARPDDHVLAP